MSDPASNVGIEDVLASVRRLVSAERRDRSKIPLPADKPQAGAQADPGALVLTADFRIAQVAPEADEAAFEDFEAFDPSDTDDADAAMDEAAEASAGDPVDEAPRSVETARVLSLEDRIAQLEAAVQAHANADFEPDGSEDLAQHRPDHIPGLHSAEDNGETDDAELAARFAEADDDMVFSDLKPGHVGRADAMAAIDAYFAARKAEEEHAADVAGDSAAEVEEDAVEDPVADNGAGAPEMPDATATLDEADAAEAEADWQPADSDPAIAVQTETDDATPDADLDLADDVPHLGNQVADEIAEDDDIPEGLPRREDGSVDLGAMAEALIRSVAQEDEADEADAEDDEAKAGLFAEDADDDTAAREEIDFDAWEEIYAGSEDEPREANVPPHRVFHPKPSLAGDETEAPAPDRAAAEDDWGGRLYHLDTSEDIRGFDFAEESQEIDEETLRDMVSDIVREELQGALGERITRNVRKLVRREIMRALSIRDFE